MADPLHEVVEMPAYLRAAEDVGLSEEERTAVIDALAANPRLGELIVGTGGACKFRWAGRGKGKSGGYRVISYFGGDDIPAFGFLEGRAGKPERSRQGVSQGRAWNDRR